MLVCRTLFVGLIEILAASKESVPAKMKGNQSASLGMQPRLNHVAVNCQLAHKAFERLAVDCLAKGLSGYVDHLHRACSCTCKYIAGHLQMSIGGKQLLFQPENQLFKGFLGQESLRSDASNKGAQHLESVIVQSKLKVA